MAFFGTYSALSRRGYVGDNQGQYTYYKALPNQIGGTGTYGSEISPDSVGQYVVTPGGDTANIKNTAVWYNTFSSYFFIKPVTANVSAAQSIINGGGNVIALSFTDSPPLVTGVDFFTGSGSSWSKFSTLLTSNISLISTAALSYDGSLYASGQYIYQNISNSYTQIANTVSGAQPMGWSKDKSYYVEFRPPSAGYIKIYTVSGNTYTLQQQINTPAGFNSAQWPAVSPVYNTETVDIIAAGDPSYATYGGVTVFTRSGTTWTLTQTITPPTGYTTTNMRFGALMSMGATGQTLVISAPATSTYTGMIFVYQLINGSYTFVQAISPTTETQSLRTPVLTGDTNYLLLGSPRYNANVGNVFVYNRT